jgi:hypothetical protein
MISFWSPLLFLYFLIHHPHHLQELLLGEYSFFHKRSGEGFSSKELGLWSYTVLNNSNFHGLGWAWFSISRPTRHVGKCLPKSITKNQYLRVHPLYLETAGWQALPKVTSFLHGPLGAFHTQSEKTDGLPC